MSEESKMLVDRCKLVAEAYTNQNAELLIGALAEDSVYENQNVIEPLKGHSAFNKSTRLPSMSILTLL